MKYQNKHRFLFPRLGLILGFMIPAFLFAQTDEEEEEDLIALTPFEVTAEEDRGYASLYTLGATRINTSLDKVAASVLVGNRELIDDLVPININEVTEWFSGIHKTSTPGVNQMIIRGQAVHGALSYRDGITEGVFNQTYHVDPFLLHRVEVVKGPAGVLFGTHIIGGIINQVWKVPFGENRTSIGTRISSYDTFGAYIDANSVSGTDNKLRTRVLVSYKNGHTRKGGPDDEFSFVPMLTYMFNKEDNTSVTFRYYYNDYHFAEARGMWFHDFDKVLPFGVIPNDVPMSNTADPHDGRMQNLHDLEVNFKHSFDALGTRWHGRVIARWRDLENNFRIWLPIHHAMADSQGNVLLDENGNEEIFGSRTTFAKYNALKAAGEDVDIIYYPNAIVRNHERSHNMGLVVADLNTEFTLGPSRHRLFTYFQTSETEEWALSSRYNWDAEKQSVFSVRPRPPSEVLSNHRPDNDSNPRIAFNDFFNWAIQDSISFFEDRFLVIGGIRYDKATGHTDFLVRGTSSDPETNSAWSTKYGFVGKPWEGVSIFYNHSETFIPRSGSNQLGDPYDNQEGLQNELGVKLYLFDNRLAMTASYFNIDFTNQLVGQDILHPTEGFITITTQEGTAVTDGWEADIIAEPIKGLELMIGMTDIDSSRVDQATGDLKKQRGVPTGFQYSIFGKYTFQGGPLEGFYAGLGVKHITDNRPGDFSDSYRIPGYDLLKGVLGYRRGPWRVNLQINNLNDKEYIVTSVARFLMTPGEPRTFGLSVDYTF